MYRGLSIFFLVDCGLGVCEQDLCSLHYGCFAQLVFSATGRGNKLICSYVAVVQMRMFDCVDCSVSLH